MSVMIERHLHLSIAERIAKREVALGADASNTADCVVCDMERDDAWNEWSNSVREQDFVESVQGALDDLFAVA